MNVPGPVRLTTEGPGKGPALGFPVHRFARHLVSQRKSSITITQWNYSHASNKR